MKILKQLNWSLLSPEERKIALMRSKNSKNTEIKSSVKKILSDIKNKGDVAVKEFTKTFDKVELNSFWVSDEEFEFALIDQKIETAIKTAITNIKIYHEMQIPKTKTKETMPGIMCEQHFLPIDKVGLYIPGGTAPLPSTLMMLAIPALIAGCREIYIITPPDLNGKINPVILVTAKILGIRRIIKCGGAQAIGALAYGTESLPQVDKIFGPGSAWVTEAKLQVGLDPNGAAIDLPAGPSEVLVIADEFSNADFIASDLLAQAEHDPSSQVILVSTSSDILEKVEKALQIQIQSLPRQNICRVALNSSKAFLVSNIEEAFELSNLYAPEHLIVQIEKPRDKIKLIKNAGSVFLGPWSPESVGDYASGTNHVLPTFGFARSFSGLTLMSFMKSISFQELTAQGLIQIGPTVEILSNAEGLSAHAFSVSIRLQELLSMKLTPNFNPALLAQPHIQKMKAYSSARSISTSANIYLDANELPYENFIQSVLKKNNNRYPVPQPVEIIEKLSQIYNVKKNQIFMGRGSDEAIEVLNKVFCDSDTDHILILPPTYGMYEISATIENLKVKKCPLLFNGTNWELNLGELALLSKDAPKIIYLCNPNNPTGTLFSTIQLEEVCRLFVNSIVVIDEAYIEFCHQESMTTRLSEFSNLVILRTLSKAWGLAGLRFGVAIADPRIIQLMQKVRAPYPISQPVIRILNSTLNQKKLSKMKNNVKKIMQQKTFFIDELSKLKNVENIYASSANFLLVQFTNSLSVLKEMKNAGILLRNRNDDVAGSIRITIGTQEENLIVLNMLKEISL